MIAVPYGYRKNAGGGGGFVPTDVADCKIWLKGSLGISQAGGLVSNWADQSGNANDFFESINKPTFNASGLDGKPTVSFGANPINLHSAAISMGERTYFIVAKAIDLSGYNLYICQNAVAHLVYDHIPSASYIYLDSNGYHYTNVTPDSNWHTLCVNTGESNFYKDNASILSFAANSNAVNSPFYLGANSGLPGQYECAEVIVYSRGITNTERDSVYNYLKSEYPSLP